MSSKCTITCCTTFYSSCKTNDSEKYKIDVKIILNFMETVIPDKAYCNHCLAPCTKFNDMMPRMIPDTRKPLVMVTHTQN